MSRPASTLAPVPPPPLTLLHAVPGRCRVRVGRLRRDVALQRAVERCLGAHPQVASFSFNIDCNSVTFLHGGRAEPILAQLRGALPVPAPSREVAPSREIAQADTPKKLQRAPRRRDTQPMPGSERTFVWACCALALSPAQALGPIAWIPLLVSGLPIWQRALGTLIRERRLNVDFLDGLALAIALGRGQLVTGALMAWMVHLGDVIRDRTALRSRREIRALLDFESVKARRLGEGGVVELVRAEALQRGETALVLAGDIVPADGVVTSGIAAVDQRNITGESVPATRREGEVLYAGSSVVEGTATLRVTAAGDETTAARIVQMLESAPLGETRIQNYAEKFADRLVAPLLGASAALLAATGNVDRFLSMSMVDYGTGIRVAAPTSVLASMMRAAREGILIKSGAHVERLARLRGVAFDKTGTLTRGRLAILDVRSFAGGLDADRVLQLAASAEVPLRHPLARALVHHATGTRGLQLSTCRDVDFVIGLGVSARVTHYRVHVGSERYLRQVGIATGRAARYLASAERRGHAGLLVAVDESLVGVLAYADELRPEAPAVVAALRERSVDEIVLLTGDRDGIARQVARTLGIRRYYAEVLPADKADIVGQLRGEGGPFAMVGDGVNDSPALAQADVGIALVEGADIAREAADVVLMEDGLFRIVDAIDISRDAMALVRQNYFLIAGCNTLALALALPTGWVSPMVTTLLSNGSAIAATLNAMRPMLR